jgi:hypothetical protein
VATTGAGVGVTDGLTLGLGDGVADGEGLGDLLGQGEGVGVGVFLISSLRILMLGLGEMQGLMLGEGVGGFQAKATPPMSRLLASKVVIAGARGRRVILYLC